VIVNDETHWMALVVELLAVAAAVVFAIWQSA
jgi:hypothetical protein